MIYTIKQHKEDIEMYEVLHTFTNRLSGRNTTWLVCVIHSDMLPEDVVDKVAEHGDADFEIALCDG